jgi:hypothetical protein
MKVKIQSKDGYKIININRRKAIRERCLNCSGWVLKEVSNCDFVDCPLYLFRSGKGKQDPEKRKNAIKAFCRWCMCGQRSEVSKCVSPDCPLLPYRMNGIDNAVKIESLTKNAHIEAVSKVKVMGEYQSIEN